MAPTTEGQERPYKKQRLFDSFGEIIALHVGEDEAVLYAHEKILCDASPYFEAACKKEWMKPDEKVIKMPEDDPLVIRVLLHWIYHDEICIPQVLGDFSTRDNIEEVVRFLLRIFVAADKYLMTRLKNDIMDATGGIWTRNLSGSLTWPRDDLVNSVYTSTAEGSSFRILMVQLLREGLDMYPPSRVFKNATYCSDFLKDMIDEFYNEVQNADHENLEVTHCSLFHTHTNKDNEDFRPCEVLKDYAISEED